MFGFEYQRHKMMIENKQPIQLKILREKFVIANILHLLCNVIIKQSY